MPDYQEYLADLTTAHPALGAELSKVRTLEHVLLWMTRRGLPLGDVEIIQQDEYSLDFIIPLESEHLVFGIT